MVVIKSVMFWIGALVIYEKVSKNKLIAIKSFSMVAIITISVCSLLAYLFNSTISFICLFLVLGIVLNKLNANEDDNFIIAYLLSLAVMYVSYLGAVMFSAMVIKLILPNSSPKSIIAFGVILIAYILLLWIIFRIKRFKNGFAFLKNSKFNNEVMERVIFIIGSIIIFYGIVKIDNTIISSKFIPIGVTLIFIGLFAIIRKEITHHYKKNMRDRTIEVQKAEIEENLKIIEEVQAENLRLGKAIHKYNHRISALENSIANVLNNKFSSEFSDELAVLLQDTKDIAAQFAQETRVKSSIDKTGFSKIDGMLEYMKAEAEKQDIFLDFKLTDSIYELVEKYIAEDKLECMLADHIKDAIIAVKHTSDKHKNILIILGKQNGIYELNILDTGIDFEIDTLMKLGTHPITTHKADGGTGLGFMTTFETLKESKASLQIEELDTSTTSYTKSVNVIWDNKCEYRIYSYRAEELKKYKHNRKINIKKLNKD